MPEINSETRVEDRPGASWIEAEINYAGAIEGRARFDWMDRSKDNLVFDTHRLPIYDARAVEGELSLDEEGLLFVQHHSETIASPALVEANLMHRYDRPAINKAYEDELIPLMRDISGAREVIAQATGTMVRFSGRAKRQTSNGVATFAHLDFSPNTVDQFLKLSVDAWPEPIAPWSRFVLLQTWRPITPAPNDSTLAVCDGRSVPLSGLIYMDSVVGEPGTIGERIESRLCRYDPQHRWYYLSNMTPEDLLVFKGFDSASPEAMNAMHSAIVEPHAGEANARGSIEARFIAFYD